MESPRRLVLQAARDVVRAVVPLACAGCGEWDTTLCERCREGLHAMRLEAYAPSLAPGLPVWGLGIYEGSLRRIVLGWKIGGRRDLDGPLRAALTPLTWALLAGLDADDAAASRSPARVPEIEEALAAPSTTDGSSSTGPHQSPRAPTRIASRPHATRLANAGGRAQDGGDLWIVPAPSSALRVLRGRPPVWPLADAAAQAAATRGRDCAVVLALGKELFGGSQRGAGAGQRRVRAQVRPRVSLEGRDVILVDDVLTTGATLEACRRAVEAEGGRVRGALVLAGARVRGRR